MKKKFTMLFAALSFMAAASAQVLTVSNAPVDGEWDENTTWYIIQNKKGGYVSSSNEYVNDEGFLMLNNTNKPAGDAALWCVVGDEANGYKFYNKSAGTDKILGSTGELNAAEKAISMTKVSEPSTVVTFDIAKSQKSGYLIVKDHGSEKNYWNHRGGNLAYWNDDYAKNDDGSSFLFTAEAEFAAALATLNSSLATANSMLEASGLDYAATPIALQTKEANGAGYISCSNIDPEEGNNMEYLIDNKNNTYIHTNWHSVSASKDYLDVYLGEGNGISLMQFSEVTRSDASNDFPASIEILGSTDGTEYTTITTVSGLPTKAGASYTSPTFECDPSYVYLRFIITGNIYAVNRPYWHMAEFDLYSVALAISEEYKAAMDEYVALFNAIEAIEAVANNANATLAQLNAANESLQAHFLAIDAAFNPEKYALMNRIEELSVYLTCGGTTVGFFPEAKIATLSAAIETAQAVIDNPESVAANYTTALENLNNTFTELDLANSVIMPKADKYYSLLNAYSGIHMNVNAEGGLISTNDGVGIGELFQFVPAEGGKFYLKSVERGTFLSTAPAHQGGQVHAAATSVEDAKPVTIASHVLENRVSITPEGGATIHHDVSQSKIVAWNGDANSRSAWKIEEVAIDEKAHKVSISEVEWATVVLGYDAVIPENVKAYAVAETTNGVAQLTEITGAIPANEAVLLNGAEGEYKFFVAESADAVANNLLEGSTINKDVVGLGYVLAAKEGVAGLYKAKLTEGKFTNHAFKAYLPVAEGAAPAMFAFSRGGDDESTGIDQLINNDEVVIYDLAGRRVEKMEKGIYIVNGKKVIR